MYWLVRGILIMELLQIELLAENFDSIYIDEQYIIEFLIDKKPNFRAGIGKDGLTEEICQYFYMEIYKAGNKSYQPYPEAAADTIFARLQRWRDITYITLHLIDPASTIRRDICYSVEWTGLYDENNENQVSYLDPQGNLHIMIG